MYSIEIQRGKSWQPRWPPVSNAQVLPFTIPLKILHHRHNHRYHYHHHHRRHHHHRPQSYNLELKIIPHCCHTESAKARKVSGNGQTQGAITRQRWMSHRGAISGRNGKDWMDGSLGGVTNRVAYRVRYGAPYGDQDEETDASCARKGSLGGDRNGSPRNSPRHTATAQSQVPNLPSWWRW